MEVTQGKISLQKQQHNNNRRGAWREAGVALGMAAAWPSWPNKDRPPALCREGRSQVFCPNPTRIPGAYSGYIWTPPPLVFSIGEGAVGGQAMGTLTSSASCNPDIAPTGLAVYIEL
jgi:hypothetical protein